MNCISRLAGLVTVSGSASPRPRRPHGRFVLGSALGLVLLAGAAFPTLAAAATNLTIQSFRTPTSFSAADNAGCQTVFEGVQPKLCDKYIVTVADAGSKPTNGSTITLTDTLPAGLELKRLELNWHHHGTGEEQTATGETCEPLPGAVCHFPSTLGPDETLEMILSVEVGPGAHSGEVNTARVSGGGSPALEVSEADQLDSPPPFGVAALFPYLAAADGTPSVQAGEHPYEFTTAINFDNAISTIRDPTQATSVGDLKDAVVDLPPGLIGSALAAPQCTLARLTTVGRCPVDTSVGKLQTEPGGTASVDGYLYNMVPEHGVAAEFGFVDALGNDHIIYAGVVPTAAGYILRATTPDTPQIDLATIHATFYGNPAAKDGAPAAPPMFTDPADCNGAPLTTSIHSDSWSDPGRLLPDGEPDLSDPAWVTTTAQTPAVGGCNKLAGLFKPTITATPSTNQGDSPTGLEVDLKVPQQSGAETLATPPLKKAVVTLPEGMSVNPSSANGLEGCSLAQIGVSPSGQPDGAAPQCPDASKIGAVELETPALPGILQGQIYVAKQSENPFGSLLAIYIVVDDPTTGVLVKIPGEIRANASTGQLETVVDNSPQFPFSELRTKFFGGQKAALRTPSVCGTYKVTSSLTPWSAPESGPPATPAASFQISQGCSESAGAEPNKPAFSAGTVDPLAGAYSPFVLKLSREDGSQELGGLSVALPPGLIGKLAGISECSEAQLAVAASREHEGGGAEEIASPSCPASSEVGSVTVGAGAGLTPYYTTGHAYLAGPYKGAPLSLAIITPAVAGPYDLGDVVVRNALEVNPETTQITAVSDPIPHILHGIPLDIRSIALNMNRPSFTLNPTSCEKKQITGSATSVLGGSAALTNPFQVGNCKALGFAPKLKLSLKGSTKHAGHPALKAVLTYPKGSYANIAKAQVNLPGSEFIDQANLNKTCTKPVLLAGACPASTVYGTAKAWTPLLAAPLEGPVYLVGGYGFKLPALVAELNGQIKVLLIGKVDSGPNKGIRNTFETVPDAPVEKFELNLKGGPKYSLLENSENLCAKPQKAIADFTAQNGKVYDTTPTIANSCKGKKGGKGKKHPGKKGKGHKGKHGKHAPGNHGKAKKSNARQLVAGPSALPGLLGEW